MSVRVQGGAAAAGCRGARSSGWPVPARRAPLGGLSAAAARPTAAQQGASRQCQTARDGRAGAAQGHGTLGRLPGQLQRWVGLDERTELAVELPQLVASGPMPDCRSQCNGEPFSCLGLHLLYSMAAQACLCFGTSSLRCWEDANGRARGARWHQVTLGATLSGRAGHTGCWHALDAQHRAAPSGPAAALFAVEAAHGQVPSLWPASHRRRAGRSRHAPCGHRAVAHLAGAVCVDPWPHAAHPLRQPAPGAPPQGGRHAVAAGKKMEPPLASRTLAVGWLQPPLSRSA